MLLCNQHRYSDAVLVASTCLKLDPLNTQIAGVVRDLERFRDAQSRNPSNEASLGRLEKAARDNPADLQAAFNLAGGYLQLRQTNQALRVLEGIMNNPKAEGAAFRGLAQAYASFGYTSGLQKLVEKLEARLQADPADYLSAIALAEAYRDLHKPDAVLRTLDALMRQPALTSNAALLAAQHYGAMGDFQRTESALVKLTQLAPDMPEAWYDLASLRAAVGKSQEALAALRHALDLSAQRRAKDPKANDLLAQARQDPGFASLRQTPEFKQLTAPRCRSCGLSTCKLPQARVLYTFKGLNLGKQTSMKKSNAHTDKQQAVADTPAAAEPWCRLSRPL